MFKAVHFILQPHWVGRIAKSNYRQSFVSCRGSADKADLADTNCQRCKDTRKQGSEDWVFKEAVVCVSCS